jgi:signal transduction histidine kinase
MPPPPSTTPAFELAASRLPRGVELCTALQRAASQARDPEALERVLLAHLVHPEGGGFLEAWLLVWTAADQRLHGWLEDRERGGTLGEALDGSRAIVYDPAAHERLALLRRWHVAPEHLGPVEAEAWAAGRATSGIREGASEPWAGGEPIWAAAVIAGHAPYGLIVARGRAAGAAAPPGDVLEAAARLAGDAVHAWRRHALGALRASQVSALAEMARCGTAAMNVAEALHLAARLAARTAQARGSALWRMRGDALQLEVTRGSAGQRERLARGLGRLVDDAVTAGNPRVLERAADDPRIERDLAAALGAVAAVPLIAFGRTHGALAVFDRATLHPSSPTGFEAEDVEFLRALCDQLALILDQAARFDALRAVERQRDDLRAWVRREERLAALGEGAAQAAREARNPLASIGAFARRAHRELPEDHALREYLEIVLRETERLDRIIDERLGAVTEQPARLAMEGLNDVVQKVLIACGERLVRRRTRLFKRLSPDLPALLLDPERIGLVVQNIIDHALDGVATGGRLRITTRRAVGFAVLEVAHDGPRPASGLLEELFTSFAPGGEVGNGLGLGTADQIVHAHGGEIRVRSEGEWTSIVSLTLPIQENSDRRAASNDRRRKRGDRRERYRDLPTA